MPHCWVNQLDRNANLIGKPSKHNIHLFSLQVLQCLPRTISNPYTLTKLRIFPVTIYFKARMTAFKIRKFQAPLYNVLEKQISGRNIHVLMLDLNKSKGRYPHRLLFLLPREGEMSFGMGKFLKAHLRPLQWHHGQTHDTLTQPRSPPRIFVNPRVVPRSWQLALVIFVILDRRESVALA